MAKKKSVERPEKPDSKASSTTHVQASHDNRSPWSGPIIIGLVTAIFGLSGTIYSSWQNLAIERQKREGNLLIEIIRSGGSGPLQETQRVANLKFFSDLGLITIERAALDALLKKHPQANTAVPWIPPATVSSAPVWRDSRVQVMDTTGEPWNAICSLRIQFPNSRMQGTGVLISPNVVLTAGYCVYDAVHGGSAINIEVIPGRSGVTYSPADSFIATKFYTVKDWVDGQSYDHCYGVAVLPRAVDGPLPLPAAVFTDSELLSHQVNVAGYATDRPSGTMWWDSSDVTQVSATAIYHSASTFGGMGGGPLWIKRDDRRELVGIHTSSVLPGKQGVRITKKVLDQLNEWIKDNPPSTPKKS